MLEGIIDSQCRVEYLSPNQGDYFFGYYDLPAYSADGKTHLAYRLPFTHRLNTERDWLEMGLLKEGQFIPFAQNDCWNFQQGALLQFRCGSNEEVFYNCFDRARGEYQTVRRNLQNNEITCFDGASACISRNGRFGLSVNFSRIWDFRPGYGYCNLKDPFFDVAQPREDGVFLIDFLSGSKKQIISYRQFAKLFPIKGEEDAKLVVNHITFNPSGNEFLMLVRNFPKERQNWGTSLVVSDLAGNMRMIYRHTMVSHYWWRDDRHIIAYCKPSKEHDYGVYDIDGADGTCENLCAEFTALSGDIHCSLSPNGKYLIGDGYPHREEYRTLWVKNLQSGRWGVLLRAKTVKPDIVDIRCDLHARFNSDGSKISFDSFHRGKRDICEIDLKGFNF